MSKQNAPRYAMVIASNRPVDCIAFLGQDKKPLVSPDIGIVSEIMEADPDKVHEFIKGLPDTKHYIYSYDITGIKIGVPFSTQDHLAYTAFNNLRRVASSIHKFVVPEIIFFDVDVKSYRDMINLGMDTATIMKKGGKTMEKNLNNKVNKFFKLCDYDIKVAKEKQKK